MACLVRVNSQGKKPASRTRCRLQFRIEGALAARGCLVLAQGAEAAGADLHAPELPTDHDALLLDVGVPAPRSVVLSVTDVVSVAGLLTTHFTHCHMRFPLLCRKCLTLYESGHF